MTVNFSFRNTALPAVPFSADVCTVDISCTNIGKFILNQVNSGWLREKYFKRMLKKLYLTLSAFKNAFFILVSFPSQQERLQAYLPPEN